MQSGPYHRKHKEGNRIKDEDSTQRNGHFLLIGVKDRADSRNGAAAAYRRTAGDQVRGLAVDLQPLPDKISENECSEDRRNRKENAGAARFEHTCKIHPEAESD